MVSAANYFGLIVCAFAANRLTNFLPWNKKKNKSIAIPGIVKYYARLTFIFFIRLNVFTTLPNVIRDSYVDFYNVC